MNPQQRPKAIMLQPVHGKDDHVLEALKREIEDYRLSSYHTFDIHVSAYPAAGAVYQSGSNGIWAGYSAYQLVQWSGLPTTLEVLIDSSGKPMVKVEGKFQRLSCWLESLQAPANWFDEPGDTELAADIKQERWAQQSRWWLANGKHFVLLKLPAEIREIVYGYVFSDWIEPYPRARVRRLDRSSQAALAKKMQFKLLLTCKQVMHEASNILFSYTPFFVEHHSILRQVTNDPTLRARLRRLTIAFTHDQYLSLFRTYTISDTGELENRKSISAEALKYMTLDSLRLVVDRPAPRTSQGAFAGACQVKFVEWLMESAWPFMRGQSVELAGCVKWRQSIAFRGRCKAFREGLKLWNEFRIADGKPEGQLVEFLQEIDDDDEEEGGVSLSEPLNEKRMKDEALTPAQRRMYPDLKCQCKKRCSPNTWSFDN